MSITGAPISLGPWNGEGLLIVSHNAVLPRNCVKCGKPTNEPLLKRKFSWHSPWYALLILIGLLPYAIVAMAVSKRMVVEVPLCTGHLERYRALRLAAIILLLACVPMMILSATALPEDYQGMGMFAGFMALLAGLICLIIYGAVLRPKYIDENFGYFRNANPGFLSLLPPRPSNILPR